MFTQIIKNEVKSMKKLKAICVAIAVILAASPAAYAFASELSLTGQYNSGNIEPTPAVEMTSAKGAENNTQDSLISEICDYDGRTKQKSYFINGDEWTVVEKIGTSFKDEKLPENLSEYEVVYQEIFPSEIQTKATYTPTTLVNTRQYYRNGDLVASVHEEYEVWYYTSGLVHLYSCSLSKSTASGYGSSNFVYGNIVNTDGSVSYLDGFKFVVRGIIYSATYDINFIVTPSYYQFY